MLIEVLEAHNYCFVSLQIIIVADALGLVVHMATDDYRLGSARAIMINFLHFIESYENAQ